MRINTYCASPILFFTLRIGTINFDESKRIHKNQKPHK